MTAPRRPARPDLAFAARMRRLRRKQKHEDFLATFERGLKLAASLTPEAEAAVAAAWAKTVCAKCFLPLNPVERMLGPVCGACTRKAHAEATR